ncbi:MAG TPA: hypothetical protein VK081_00010 [Planctomycetota bacterium]|nr:hypothetical protein [Planctomycetota bacterium]
MRRSPPGPQAARYPSQRVRELIARLGNPDHARGEVAAHAHPQHGRLPSPSPVDAPPSADASLRFGDQVILVSAGRVLGTWVPPTAMHGGPR